MPAHTRHTATGPSSPALWLPPPPQFPQQRGPSPPHPPTLWPLPRSLPKLCAPHALLVRPSAPHGHWLLLSCHRASRTGSVLAQRSIACTPDIPSPWGLGQVPRSATRLSAACPQEQAPPSLSQAPASQVPQDQGPGPCPTTAHHHLPGPQSGPKADGTGETKGCTTQVLGRGKGLQGLSVLGGCTSSYRGGCGGRRQAFAPRPTRGTRSTRHLTGPCPGSLGAAASPSARTWCRDPASLLSRRLGLRADSSPGPRPLPRRRRPWLQGPLLRRASARPSRAPASAAALEPEIGPRGSSACSWLLPERFPPRIQP